jgi:hypothetical protein
MYRGRLRSGPEAVTTAASYGPVTDFPVRIPEHLLAFGQPCADHSCELFVLVMNVRRN